MLTTLKQLSETHNILLTVAINRAQKSTPRTLLRIKMLLKLIPVEELFPYSYIQLSIHTYQS